MQMIQDPEISVSLLILIISMLTMKACIVANSDQRNLAKYTLLFKLNVH